MPVFGFKLFGRPISRKYSEWLTVVNHEFIEWSVYLGYRFETLWRILKTFHEGFKTTKRNEKFKIKLFWGNYLWRMWISNTFLNDVSFYKHFAEFGKFSLQCQIKVFLNEIFMSIHFGRHINFRRSFDYRQKRFSIRCWNEVGKWLKIKYFTWFLSSQLRTTIDRNKIFGWNQRCVKIKCDFLEDFQWIHLGVLVIRVSRYAESLKCFPKNVDFIKLPGTSSGQVFWWGPPFRYSVPTRPELNLSLNLIPNNSVRYAHHWYHR